MKSETAVTPVQNWSSATRFYPSSLHDFGIIWSPLWLSQRFPKITCKNFLTGDFEVSTASLGSWVWAYYVTCHLDVLVLCRVPLAQQLCSHAHSQCRSTRSFSLPGSARFAQTTRPGAQPLILLGTVRVSLVFRLFVLLLGLDLFQGSKNNPLGFTTAHIPDVLSLTFLSLFLFDSF